MMFEVDLDNSEIVNDVTWKLKITKVIVFALKVDVSVGKVTVSILLFVFSDFESHERWNSIF